ncbi:unnamed protein product [Angiostrongylus costaricensis]|uniref:Uncharacterized protein n=1 Tax=Angiostrongylus costaricensis TaxID=334426 RepID=A0A0R3PMT0_ANGCS|nr:unnamed protein product [Angiostrongylus costaricensis]
MFLARVVTSVKIQCGWGMQESTRREEAAASRRAREHVVCEGAVSRGGRGVRPTAGAINRAGPTAAASCTAGRVLFRSSSSSSSSLLLNAVGLAVCVVEVSALVEVLLLRCASCLTASHHRADQLPIVVVRTEVLPSFIVVRCIFFVVGFYIWAFLPVIRDRN